MHRVPRPRSAVVFASDAEPMLHRLAGVCASSCGEKGERRKEGGAVEGQNAGVSARVRWPVARTNLGHRRDPELQDPQRSTHNSNIALEERMIYDVNSVLFRSFLAVSGGAAAGPK